MSLPVSYSHSLLAPSLKSKTENTVQLGEEMTMRLGIFFSRGVANFQGPRSPTPESGEDVNVQDREVN